MYSIRDRLLWTFAIVVLLTGIAATYMTFISARGQVDSLLDMQLKQVAISLESHVAAEQRIQRQIERNEEQFVVQWIDRETQRVHVSHKITPFPYSEQTGFSTIRHDGETWRLYTLVADKTIIVSAQPTDIRVGLAFSSALHILQPLVLITLKSGEHQPCWPRRAHGERGQLTQGRRKTGAGLFVWSWLL